ncbi:MAG TPA: hypothetical protein P5528_13425 [Steroidobacteraceae bacterium]|nr:hypothetical protein [Steroidobacteraceae bacterium]
MSAAQPLPLEAVRLAPGHHDARAVIFKVIPPRRVPVGKRAFWWLVLRLARFPLGYRLLLVLRRH